MSERMLVFVPLPPMSNAMTAAGATATLHCAGHKLPQLCYRQMQLHPDIHTLPSYVETLPMNIDDNSIYILTYVIDVFQRVHKYVCVKKSFISVKANS